MPTYIGWESGYWDATSLEASFAQQSSEQTFATVSQSTNIWNYHRRLDEDTVWKIPKVKEDLEVGFTVTLCYCPNYDTFADADNDACNSGYEYTQTVGRLHMWFFNICAQTTYSLCEYKATIPYVPAYQPYSRITPGQPFIIKLICPPGGCDETDTNRMRILGTNNITLST